MPFDPAQIGRKLIVVGEGQVKAGNKLKQCATELREVGATLDDNARVDQALGSIQRATRSIRELLSPIATALHWIAGALDGITVPDVDFDRRQFDIPVIGKVRLVTGITISQKHPLRPIGLSVESVADNLDNVRAGLEEIADGTNDLQDQLPTIQGRILSGADDMEKGGQDLISAGTAMQDAGTLLAG
jgi:hypothetical protein